MNSSPVQLLDAYPADYLEARERFLEAASRAGCTTQAWPITVPGPNHETLTIDVARWGPPNLSRWLLLTSGLHGTEGPFGSAAQLSFLHHLVRDEPQNVGVLFLHALNPFGYAWVRRANENNVDLNRNFLLPGEPYAGAHPLYRHVYHAFDPHRRAWLYDNFYMRAWWLIARHSRAALQTSLPIGQYDFPKGLFFGGQGPEQTQLLLQQHLAGCLPAATEVTHLDFHTGLGRWADYRLLIDVEETDLDAQWFTSWAGARHVECARQARTAYMARGSLGPWMRTVVFPHCRYRYAAAEFGTYHPVRVLHSLVNELRIHYVGQPGQPRYQRAKQRVRETFVPSSPHWRVQAGQGALRVCVECFAAMK